MPEINKEKIVEIAFSKGIIYVHNIATGTVKKFDAFQLQTATLKYLSEFYAFFNKSVEAERETPVLLSPEAVKVIESIMDFNRIAF